METIIIIIRDTSDVKRVGDGCDPGSFGPSDVACVVATVLMMQVCVCMCMFMCVFDVI